MKLYDDIVSTLRSRAADYPPAPPAGDPERRATFQFGTLTLTCPAYRESILAMADKYAKPPKFGAPPPLPRPRYPRKAVKPGRLQAADILEEHPDNAAALAGLFP